MTKIAIIGAGSHVFSHRLVADCLTWPALQDASIALMDINAEKVEFMGALSRKMVEQQKVGAEIIATTDLKTALEGADYVFPTIRASESRAHIDIPFKYGINQSVGDTSGPGGAFYFLRNAPPIIGIAKAMEEVSPDGLILNYTNPMAMLCWAIDELSKTRCVGLCHSVQGTARTLAGYIGVGFEEVSYWVAGINHMSWFLEYRRKGKDAYPMIWEAMKDPDIYERDIVRWEVMRHFGAFVSESSIHCSEYMPYFRRTPEMIERYMRSRWVDADGKPLSPKARAEMWDKRRQERDEGYRRMAYGDEEIVVERSNEFGSLIINAIETNEPYLFNGNVTNTGLITNLLAGCIVEVPIVADAVGLHPCYVGDLPPALASLNRTNVNLHELVVKGFVEGDRESVYRAIQLDPLTSSKLTLPEIREMVSEMFEAEKEWITI